jgi:class 3 adenylate cyclase
MKETVLFLQDLSHAHTFERYQNIREVPPMTTQDFKRKLTAIHSADVEGYSRLMGEDEEATVRTITAYREVMTTLIQQHSGICQ